jgi:hypothetical protein
VIDHLYLDQEQQNLKWWVKQPLDSFLCAVVFELHLEPSVLDLLIAMAQKGEQ